MNNEKNLKYLDESEALRLLPRRPSDGNKGSFGKVAMFVGSEKYRGAAHLALSSAIRGGAGYTKFFGSAELAAELRPNFPEAIYSSPNSYQKLARELKGADSVLVGCGSDVSEALAELCQALAEGYRGNLILDADAINSIASYSSVDSLPVGCNLLFTPHPLEFSRLSGIGTEEIARDRVGTAKQFAKTHKCIILLKGQGTVITDGDRTYVNTTGSSALAKAGSGDVLAGLIASLAASIKDLFVAASLGAYLHGAAGDTLANELSSFGVTPSDLPKAIAREINKLEDKQSLEEIKKTLFG